MGIHSIRGVAVAALAAALLGASPVQDEDPAERQLKFLKGIREGKIAESYAAILEGSLIKEKKADVENLVGQTRKAFEVYGAPSDVEHLGIVTAGKHLSEGLAIVCCEKSPLFFHFIWYRPSAEAPWRMQNLWFDDNPRAYFERRK